jgi:translocation and assembly module TamA
VERSLRRLALLALAAAGGYPTPAGADGERTVNGLHLEGVPDLDADAIKKGLATTEPQWWEGPWSRHPFDPNEWQTDQRRMETACWAQGYYQARFLYPEVTLQRGDGVSLTAHLAQGEPTLVSEVQGLEAIPPEVREVVLKDFPLRQGAVFRQADWVKARRQLQSRLLEQGFRDARVEGEVEVGWSTLRADARFDIKVGERFRFGRIDISPQAPQVPRERILEEIRDVLRPGDRYSPNALKNARERLFATGLFADVEVDEGPLDGTTIPVLVSVRDSLHRTFSVGGGVGMDLAHNELHVIAEHTDRNFFGDLRRLSFHVKAGWAFIPGLVAAFAPRDSPLPSPRSGWTLDALAQLEQPGFILPNADAQISFGFAHDLEPAYESNESRLKLGAIWQLSPELSVFPSYNLQFYHLSGLLTPEASSEPGGPGCVPEAGSCDLALSYGEVTVEYDGRGADRQEPSKGWYGGLSVQVGYSPTQGGYSYLRVQPEARYFQSFDWLPRFTLSTKLKLGTLVRLHGAADSPIVARFYGGGSSSMRGFGAYRLSPMLRLTSPGPDGTERSEAIPVGGNGLFEGSVEARYQLRTNLYGAVFLDTGFVTAESFDFSDPTYLSRNMLYAVGIGARYRTPLGVIRVDLARRLDIGQPLPMVPQAAQAPATTASCFGLFRVRSASAGAPEGPCVFHLSIGEAF